MTDQQTRTLHDLPRLLAKHRESAGLSQADLAARAGVAPSAVSHYERGARTPSLANALRIAGALDMSLDELVGRAPPSLDGHRALIESLRREVDTLRARLEAGHGCRQ